MADDPSKEILGSLSILDRLLPIWIFVAMGAGVLIGYVLPQTGQIIDSFQIDSVSLPIAIGLIWMMYPPLAGVNYNEIGKVKTAKKMMSLSLILNWLVGPFVMFAFAWILLPDLPLFRDGIIMVGLARCIAMVLVWNMLAGGDSEYAAVIVALNAAFQIALYSVYAYFFITVLPVWLDPSAAATVVNINPWDIARSVAIFLGVPFAMGIATRYLLQGRKKDENWYEEKFLKKLKPTALIGLLFTLVVMFSLQGNYFVQLPLDIVRVAIPLVAYFLVMFVFSYLLSWKLKFSYEETATTAFTAASNNFELAIATAIAVFGLSSSQAFATTVGPLIEVPVMIGLVYVSLWLKPRLFRVPRSKSSVQETKPVAKELQGV
ncbi:MAG: ACR3 family arsenite efflux transporter [Thaumarchaeota archaeon]|nr:ACR3 family arsenite efflux transporter [Nitrososphaerota archaeon]MCL5068084.1 ACR3 family arsenite efflux transporter [Nitrososphaerota archaeon]